MRFMTNIPEPPSEFRRLVLAEIAAARRRCLEINKMATIGCSGCGCPYDQKTPGCPRCYNRHYQRDRPRQQRHHEPRSWTCKGCGCHHDEQTPGCKNCQARHAMRRRLSERKAQFLATLAVKLET